MAISDVLTALEPFVPVVETILVFSIAITIASTVVAFFRNARGD